MLLSLASLALFLAVDGAQATERAVAQRTLRRAVASLTEADSLAPAVLPQLKEQTASDAQEPLTVPDFPVQVGLTPEEAAGLTPSELREILVERSAAAIYEDGMSVFRADGGPGDPRSLTVAGAIDDGLGFLRERNYDGLRVTVWALAAVCAALAAFIGLVGRGYARLTLIGAALSATAVPLLVLAVGVRFGLRLAADATDDYISSELLRLGQDVSWVPIRNGIAFAGLGLAFLLLGLAGSWLQAPRQSEEARPSTGPGASS